MPGLGGHTSTAHPRVQAAHLSDMAICSSIAEPVLVFQFPDTDVLLESKRRQERGLGGLGCTRQGRGPLPRPWSPYAHVGLVVLPNLLDAHIVFGINEGLGSGICLGQCHDTCDVLEVVLVVHLDLWEWGGEQGPVRRGRQLGCLRANDTGEVSAQKFGGHPKALKHALILGLLVFTCTHRHQIGCLQLCEHTKPDF